MIDQYPRHLLCQNVKNGIRILKVFSDRPNLSLPGSVDGKKVTEIGPYCFSASEKKLPEDAFMWSPGSPSSSSDFFEAGKDLRPASGLSVESVRLPDETDTLHNGSFYNCRNLKQLSVGPKIRSVGSDVFTNCRQLRHLIIREDDRAPTGLPLLLERLPDDLTVRFPGQSLLFFPEYYEWLDEVAAAHHFSRSIHGEGYRMRKSFRNKILDYDKYDQCFGAVLTAESDETVCRTALARLTLPRSLSPSSREAYLQAVKERASVCLQIAIDRQDPQLLNFICQRAEPSYDLMSEAAAYASDRKWSEGCAILMEQSHRVYQKQSFDFDMDF